MKTIKRYMLFIALLLVAQVLNAQFLKKLKDKLSGDETPVPTQKVSHLDQKFDDWDLGEADIIAISVFADDFEKHQEKIGTIRHDGSFELSWPDSVKTWVPVSVYDKDCENADEVQIVNPKVKMAWNRLFVYRNGEHLGGIIPANPVKAAYNLNQGDVNNGKLGHYYLWLYADGNASASIDCSKIKAVTDGKDTTYPEMTLKDNFDLHYKKGWNIVQVTNIDNIWVGRTKHYTEREWKVVPELPKNTTWVFRPKVQE